MDKSEKTCNSVEIREKTKKSKMIKKEKIIKNRKNGKMIFKKNKKCKRIVIKNEQILELRVITQK